jgi:hypothetical protein
MKRPLPRLEVLGLTAALALVSSCSPNNSVQPGAPVLTELSVVEPGASGPTLTTVTASTLSCPAGTAEGGSCTPGPATAVCEALTTNNLCRCVATPMTAAAPPAATDAGVDGGTDAGAKAGADAGAADAAPPPPAGGSWSCSFAPTSMVLYVFDRVLYTAPLDPGDAAGLTTLATTTFLPPAPAIALLGDYASNGSPNEVIFPLLGDFRSDGPSILFSGVPALPTSSTVTVTLDPTKVLAKDGRTPFVGMSLLKDGIISFVTQPFTAVVAGPPTTGDAAPPTAAPDMTPATITFTNTVDPGTLKPHIQISAVPPLPVGFDFDVASMDGLHVTVTPTTNWPPISMITITVDAGTADLAGDVLGGAGATVTFNTSAM